MIPTYNCAKYLEKTLQSVLSQGIGESDMQIEVIDDCSNLDDPEDVVLRVGNGRVSFFRQKQNVGVVNNFNTCIRRAKGEYIHILHGDDWVDKLFYKTVDDIFQKQPDVSCVFARSFIVDSYGEIDRLSPRVSELESFSFNPEPIFYENPICTPGVVIKKSFYEMDGFFDSQLIHTADWDMWIRVISKGGAVFINNPLAYYRMFSENDTNRLIKTGENLIDYIRLSKKLKSIYHNYSEKKFKRKVSEKALFQLNMFRQRGMASEYKNNLKVYKQTASTLNYIKEIYLRNVLNLILQSLKRY